MEINEASEKFRGDEIAPMHTAEHILNGTMVKMFRRISNVKSRNVITFCLVNSQPMR